MNYIVGPRSGLPEGRNQHEYELKGRSLKGRWCEMVSLTSPGANQIYGHAATMKDLKMSMRSLHWRNPALDAFLGTS